MQIDLTYSEGEMLLQLLDEHCRELRFEISHTDHREYRQVLENRLEMLEGLATRLMPSSSRTSMVEVA